MIKGILLAAGQSSRFGGQKLTASLPDGTAVGLKSALAVAGAVDSLTIITRAQDTGLKNIFTTAGLTCLDCEHATDGISASIKAGINASRDASAWVIALADMPFVHRETLKKLVEALHRGHDIVQPTFAGRAGNPVGFQRAYLDELMTLSGDRGARDILRRHRQRVFHIAVDDKGVLLDVDTPGDLEGRLP